MLVKVSSALELKKAREGNATFSCDESLETGNTADVIERLSRKSPVLFGQKLLAILQSSALNANDYKRNRNFSSFPNKNALVTIAYKKILIV